ncbi:hypothetical protein AAVH_36029, partial [Aphelenchoides avenae]
AQETAYTVVNIRIELPERTYCDTLLDDIVNHLRPRATEFSVPESAWYDNGDDQAYLEFLVRDSFLTSLTCCLY